MNSLLDGKYSIEMVSPSGETIGDVSRMALQKNLQFIRNGSYNAQFQLSLDDLEKYAGVIGVNPRSLMAIGKNKVVIKRRGVALFSGLLDYHEGALSDQKTLDVRVSGWFDLLADRQTSQERIFASPGTDAATLAWTLISESQAMTNGNLGITQGTLAASVPRIRTYNGKPLKDAISDLTTVFQGFDFEITPDKIFNVYYPKMGVRRSELGFTFPGNIKDGRVSYDATPGKLINYILARGQGFGSGQIIDVLQDSSSQGNYGLRQSVNDFSDIPDVQTLDDLANEIINKQKVPIQILTITIDGNREPIIGSYWLGDEVKVVIEGLALYDDINAYFKIDQIDLKIDENDNEEIQLKLTAV